MKLASDVIAEARELAELPDNRFLGVVPLLIGLERDLTTLAHRLYDTVDSLLETAEQLENEEEIRQQLRS